MLCSIFLIYIMRERERFRLTNAFISSYEKKTFLSRCSNVFILEPTGIKGLKLHF